MRAFLGFFFSCGLFVFQAGCDGDDDGGDDCAYEPDPCPSVSGLDFCADGACTFNGSPVSCTTSRCEIPAAGTLVVPINGRVGATMPDLSIHVVAYEPTSLGAVRFDGKDMPFDFDNVYFMVHWAPGTPSPTTIELDFGSAQNGLSLRFHDEECEIDAQLACNGGGA